VDAEIPLHWGMSAAIGDMIAALDDLGSLKDCLSALNSLAPIAGAVTDEPVEITFHD
jgi:hypothetical protein